MNGFDIPKAPNAGDRISARFFQGIIDALQRLKPKAGEGVRLEYGRDGVTIHAKPGKGGGDGAVDLSAFPFRVVDASDTEGAKVRVLPGVCNFTVPTVAGELNEYWTESSHVADAPRIDCSDAGLAEGFWIALEFAAPNSGEIHPSAVDTVAVQALELYHVPLARVVAELDSGTSKVVIKEIRQMVFDIIGATAAARDTYGDPIWAITR